MTAGLGFYGAENIGRTAAFVFVIPPCLPSRGRRRGRPHVGMQGDWLLIQTNQRLLRVVWPFVHLQHVFHLGDIVVIEIGHHPHFFPATVSNRGSAGESEWFHVPPVAPACV